MLRTLLIGVAVFGLGWGASFGAGAAWGRRGVGSPTQAAAPNVSRSGQVGQVGQGQGSPDRSAAVGSVDRVDGRTLFVTGPDGRQVKVSLADQTQIVKQGPGTAADLTAGSRVVVTSQGQPAVDGSAIAATVNIVPDTVPGDGNQFGPFGDRAGEQRGQGASQTEGQGGQSRDRR